MQIRRIDFDETLASAGAQMTPQTEIFTAEELLRAPGDDHRYELVEGELRKMVPSGYLHGKVVARLTWRLAQYVEERKLGEVCGAETGFLLARDPDTVRAPDIAFVSHKRIEEKGEAEGFWPGAPDLAVEVVSPSDTYTEVEAKAIAWLDAGCRLVFAVDPRQRTATAYRSRDDIAILDINQLLDGGDVVPDWTVPVLELFP